MLFRKKKEKHPNPMLAARWATFRSHKRGYWSLWIFSILFVQIFQNFGLPFVSLGYFVQNVMKLPSITHVKSSAGMHFGRFPFGQHKDWFYGSQ